MKHPHKKTSTDFVTTVADEMCEAPDDGEMAGNSPDFKPPPSLHVLAKPKKPAPVIAKLMKLRPIGLSKKHRWSPSATAGTKRGRPAQGPDHDESEQLSRRAKK